MSYLGSIGKKSWWPAPRAAIQEAWARYRACQDQGLVLDPVTKACVPPSVARPRRRRRGLGDLGRVWAPRPTVHVAAGVTPQQLAVEKYKAWHPTSTVKVMPGGGIDVRRDVSKMHPPSKVEREGGYVSMRSGRPVYVPGPPPVSRAYGRRLRGMSGLAQSVTVSPVQSSTVKAVIGGSALLVLGAAAFFVWRATKNG